MTIIRRVSVFFLILFFSAALLGAQEIGVADDFSSIGPWRAASGNWVIADDGRLEQRDGAQTIAMISRPVVQRGYVTYQFDITVLGGFEDHYGGFGFFIGVNDPSRVRSWGNGQSYLLWITYDREAYGEGSFFGQLYKSNGLVSMDMLVAGDRYPVPLPGFTPGNPSSVAGITMQVVVEIDFATGAGTFRDLSGGNRAFYFSLPGPVPAGTHVTFRTNSARVAIDNFRVLPRTGP